MADLSRALGPRCEYKYISKGNIDCKLCLKKIRERYTDYWTMKTRQMVGGGTNKKELKHFRIPLVNEFDQLID